MLGKKDRSDDLKEKKLLEETERVRGGDWKETLMSCWGRKTGSDDLKQEKLLEETERVRGGTGRKH